MEYEMKKIGYFSVFKLVLTIGLVVGIVLGVILGALTGAGFVPYGNSISGFTIAFRKGVAFGVIIGVVGGILWAILSAIISMIYVFLYNLAAGLVGGIEVELEGEKPSRICPNCGYKLPEDAEFCPNYFVQTVVQRWDYEMSILWC